MTEQLKEIAMRLKTLRQIMDVTEEEMAEVCAACSATHLNAPHAEGEVLVHRYF